MEKLNINKSFFISRRILSKSSNFLSTYMYLFSTVRYRSLVYQKLELVYIIIIIMLTLKLWSTSHCIPAVDGQEARNFFVCRLPFILTCNACIGAYNATHSTFTRPKLPVVMAYPDCFGTEDQLSLCRGFNNYGVEPFIPRDYCTRHTVAGVKCIGEYPSVLGINGQHVHNNWCVKL